MSSVNHSIPPANFPNQSQKWKQGPEIERLGCRMPKGVGGGGGGGGVVVVVVVGWRGLGVGRGVGE